MDQGKKNKERREKKQSLEHKKIKYILSIFYYCSSYPDNVKIINTFYISIYLFLAIIPQALTCNWSNSPSRFTFLCRKYTVPMHQEKRGVDLRAVSGEERPSIPGDKQHPPPELQPQHSTADKAHTYRFTATGKLNLGKVYWIIK